MTKVMYFLAALGFMFVSHVVFRIINNVFLRWEDEDTHQNLEYILTHILVVLHFITCGFLVTGLLAIIDAPVHDRAEKRVRKETYETYRQFIETERHL